MASLLFENSLHKLARGPLANAELDLQSSQRVRKKAQDVKY
jgi:hypothetical protein